MNSFSVNAANELASGSYSGNLTVAGTTTSVATNVTVNTSNAFLYADATFTSTNQPIANGSPREMRGREGINHVAAIVPFGFHAAICGLSHGEINTFTAIAKDTYGRRATNTVTAWLPSSPSYTYDANGNLLSDGTRNFAYDDENQLIAAWVTNAWQSTFAYDGKMRRRIRKEYTWSSGAWVQTNEVHYIYEGNVPIQERDINNLPATTYTRGTDLSGTRQGAGGIGGLLARTVNSASLDPALASSAHAFYHADGNGNFTCLISAAQEIAAKYAFDPFGNILSQSGPLADANLHRFSSEEYHATSGLTCFFYRFYDANLQRWVNRDPLGDLGSLTLAAIPVQLRRLIPPGEVLQQPDLYAFVANDPESKIDPLGLAYGGIYRPTPPQRPAPCPCPPGQTMKTLSDVYGGTLACVRHMLTSTLGGLGLTTGTTISGGLLGNTILGGTGPVIITGPGGALTVGTVAGSLGGAGLGLGAAAGAAAFYCNSVGCH